MSQSSSLQHTELPVRFIRQLTALREVVRPCLTEDVHDAKQCENKRNYQQSSVDRQSLDVVVHGEVGANGEHRGEVRARMHSLVRDWRVVNHDVLIRKVQS